MTSKMKYVIAVTGLSLGLIVSASVPFQGAEAAGSVCHPGGQAYSKKASGVRKSKAQERARGKWNDYARSLMGTSRANWGNAKYRGYSCNKAGIWYCRAIATPCI